jgi:hypothetical protein
MLPAARRAGAGAPEPLSQERARHWLFAWVREEGDDAAGAAAAFFYGVRRQRDRPDGGVLGLAAGAGGCWRWCGGWFRGEALVIAGGLGFCDWCGYRCLPLLVCGWDRGVGDDDGEIATSFSPACARLDFRLGFRDVKACHCMAQGRKVPAVGAGGRSVASRRSGSSAGRTKL